MIWVLLGGSSLVLVLLLLPAVGLAVLLRVCCRPGAARDRRSSLRAVRTRSYRSYRSYVPLAADRESSSGGRNVS